MICSFIVLYKSSSYLVDSATKLAAYFNLPEFVIGFVIIAIGTSLPELSVSSVSSLLGDPNISIGNILGSNIVNIALVLAIAVLIYKKIKVESEFLLKDMFISMGLSIIPLILILVIQPNMFLGLIFLIMFVYYISRMMTQKQFRKGVEVKPREAVIAGAIIIPAIALVIFSSYLITIFGQTIASLFSVSSFLVGMSIVALGTSLPELATIIVSLKKGYNYLAWGNIMGSLVANSTLVLGTTLFLSNKQFTGINIIPAVGLLVDGISFILIYCFYVILEFLINA